MKKLVYDIRNIRHVIRQDYKNNNLLDIALMKELNKYNATASFFTHEIESIIKNIARYNKLVHFIKDTMKKLEDAITEVVLLGYD